MKRFFYYLIASTILVSCTNENSDSEDINLKSFKDKISYALGADHARAISESGDPNYNKYNLDKIIAGFADGLKNDKAFDETCKNNLMKLYGPTRKGFDAKYADQGSECIGKLSGMIFNTSWKKNNGLDKLDLKLVQIGFKHAIQKRDTLIKRDEQSMMIQNFMFDMYKINGLNMIEEAKTKKGVKISKNGVVVETIKEGTGTNPQAGDDVLAHYILMSATGDTLQSSFDMVEVYKQPLNPFSLKSVIPGWQEGMPLMKKGGTYKLYVPYQMGYGEQGMYNPQTRRYDIPPFQSLIFYIELINHGKSGTLVK
jgi:FKBP-type peptidyl-prolyl cis-trans isomerase FklB